MKIGEDSLEVNNGQYTVRHGDMVTVQCEVEEANPEPIISLFMDGQQVNIVSSTHYRTVQNTGNAAVLGIKWVHFSVHEL